MINKYIKFIEKNYLQEYYNNIRDEKNYLEINFNKISKFDPLLANILLDNPEETIKAISIACEQFDTDKEIQPQIIINNLPKSTYIPLGEVSDQIGKFLTFEGYVMKPSEIYLKCKSAKFECKVCGSIINILMLTNDWKVPKKCHCGAKGDFLLLDKKFVKFQKLEIEESMDHIPDKVRKPAVKKVLLEENLTRKDLNESIQPGQLVRIYGFLELEQLKKNNKNTNEFKSYIIANNIIPIERSWESIKLTKKDKYNIKIMANNKDLLVEFAQSLAPSYEGYLDLRQSLILQHVGGKRIKDENGNLEERGIISILLCSDPSKGKTYLTKRSLNLSPLWYWTQGAGLTKCGLVASVVKDDYGNYTLEVGPLPLAHKGLLVIDEGDKMNKQDYGILNNAMNDEQTQITKANINQTLKTETNILMASNPIHKKFIDSQSESIMAQLKPLPKDLLDRFDIIWAMRGKINNDKVEKKYLDRHLKSNNIKQKWSNLEMQKYIAYSRKLNPIILPEVAEYFSKKFKKLIGTTHNGEQSHRLRGNIFRWIYSHSKFFGVGKEDKDNNIIVTHDSVNFAFNIIKKSFEYLGLIDNKGFAGFEDLEEIPSQKEIKIYYVVKDIIKELTKIYKKEIPYERILEESKNKIGIDNDELDKEIEKLKNIGDLFEPKRGYFGLL